MGGLAEIAPPLGEETARRLFEEIQRGIEPMQQLLAPSRTR